jgi:hypothetical protein
MDDTTPEAVDVQRRILRGMSLARKAALLDELCETARALTLAGIRNRHPEYSERDAQLALWRMLHGDAVFRRAWPGAPLHAP